MVAINIIEEEDELVAEWQKSHGYTIPVLIGGKTGDLIRRYQIMGTPLNYLLDSRGRVVDQFRGYQPGQEEKIENEIRKHLKLRL